MAENPSRQAGPDAASIAAAHAIYTRRALKFYDLVVHGISNRLAWGCPTARLLQLYQDNLSADHLEAGVGTGLFLDRSGRKDFRRLTLLDINPACLATASERLQRYGPELRRASLFDSLASERAYDSVGLTYVLHCLPGAMAEKLAVLDQLRNVMHGKTVLFGATILGADGSSNAAARGLMRAYNARRIFNNSRDSLTALVEGLKRRFGDVTVERRGCVALFTARKPRGPLLSSER